MADVRLKAARLIAASSFSAVYFLNESVFKYVAISVKPIFLGFISVELSDVAKFAASVGLFSLIFEILFSTTSNIYRRFAAPEMKIRGRWYFILIAESYHEKDKGVDPVRIGEVQFEVDEESKLILSGISHLRDDNRITSQWFAHFVHLHGRSVSFIYESHSSNRGPIIGNMLLSFDPKARKMIGSFNDARPASNFGRMEFYREAQERNERMQFAPKKVEQQTASMAANS